MQGTYKHDHPLSNKGKGHPQVRYSACAPPLSLSSTPPLPPPSSLAKYSLKSPPHENPPWQPHSFWPVPDSTEDAVLLVWAHPSNPPEAMDRVFFTNILRYVSDVHEKKVGLDVLQVMLMQSVAPAKFVSRSNIPPGEWCELVHY
jgi:hypothetical protein